LQRTSVILACSALALAVAAEECRSTGCLQYDSTSSVQRQVLVHVHVGVGVGQKADLQGLDDGNAFNGTRNPIRCLVWHSALCTLHSALQLCTTI
jgi:hypothetical protein